MSIVRANTSEAQPNDQDAALRERARRVIPGGMWGHMNAARLPAAYPQFFSRSQGCRVWDANGREYIDFMCAYGPMVLGYQDPDVDAAAAAERARGDIANGPSERLVELAEILTHTIAHADWAMLSKNGTDATTACVTIARAGTRKRKVLVAKGAYHGAVPWCTPSLVGVTAEDRAHLIYFEFNDIESFHAAVAQAGDDFAAVIVTAFRHEVLRDQEMPTKAFATAVRAACDAAGAALIVDDVRAGFRLNLRGSWEVYGVRPDLSAFSKAIANGHPLAAVTGNDRFREAAQGIFVTGSFWYASVAMAAGVATITKLRDTDALARLERAGQRFRHGLARQAERHGVGLRQTGPVQMPQVLFDDDPKLDKGNLFVSTALEGGVYLHPWHNMFLSAAHTDADIDAALSVTDVAMRAVAAAS